MDADHLIEKWKYRLQAMAQNPPFVFRNTSQTLIDKYRAEACTFRGAPEARLVAIEAKMGIALPRVFRAFLRHMVKSPGGLFRGSDLAKPAQFARFRTSARKLLAPVTKHPALPPEAVVFLFHQGYTFLYILADGGFDGPVWQWTEGDQAPRQCADSFCALVDAELKMMEATDADWRERGGYYKTLYADGGGMDDFPSLNSGDRPLDRRAPGAEWKPFLG